MSRAKGLNDGTLTKTEWGAKTRKGGRDTARPVASTSETQNAVITKRQRKDEGPSNANVVFESSIHLDDDQGEIREEPNQTKTTTQNDYLHQFLERRDFLLKALYESESPPLGGQCTTCLKGHGQYRCTDCLGQHFTCEACTKAGHQKLPFHRIQAWTGTYYAPASLWQLGIKLHLGHGGALCPSHNIPANVVQEEANAEAAEGTTGGTARREDPADRIPVASVSGNPRTPTRATSEANSHAPAIDETPPFTIPALVAAWRAERQTAITLSPEEQLADIQEELFDPEDESIDDINNLGTNAEDEESVDAITVHYPSLMSTPPSSDAAGNRFIKVVAMTGIHHLPAVPCYCAGAADEYLQFMQIGLFPASYKRVATAFTFELMDDFRLSNLECKVSAYQYFQKIRRITNPIFPHSVPNRYIELRRLSRAWRNLRLQQQHGFSFQTNHGAPGSMALFCAACPQPYVNLPPNWQQTVKELAMQYHMMDGNFKGDHLKQKYSQNDVWLWRGLMYMADETMVAAHEKQALKAQKKISKQKASQQYSTPVTPCHSYHAVNDSNKTIASCDYTGHGITACRHGCFVPASGVNFRKGERQMLMDLSMSEAFKHSNSAGLPRLCAIYDINCQFCQNLTVRFSNCDYLELPDTEIIYAIGLFHVHGHQESCLYEYATTFIPGMAIVDGEILETLWSPLNRIFRSMRTASLAQRSEVFDDHKGDSNWKKMLGITKSICKKYRRAVAESADAAEAFQGLQDAAPLATVKQWELEITDAERKRHEDVTVMSKVMKNRLVKVISKKDLLAKLAMEELEISGDLGQSAWISAGLDLEEEQILLAQFVKRLGPEPPLSAKLDLIARRQTLRSKILKFAEQARRFLGDAAVDFIANRNLRATGSYIPDDPNDWIDGEPKYTLNRSPRDPECEALPLPIALHGLHNVTILDISKLVSKEYELRRGQATDALQRIREDLSHLAWQYKKQVRLADSVNTATRSWDSVHILNKHWRDLRQIYLHSRSQMISVKLTAEADYPMLTMSDCRVSIIIPEPNARLQRDRGLSWIWTPTILTAEADTAQTDFSDQYILEFYRLHYLRARARTQRWDTELRLTQAEMSWVTRFFIHMARRWSGYRDSNAGASRGELAFTERQISVWNELGRVSEESFQRTSPEHIPVWEEVL